MNSRAHRALECGGRATASFERAVAATPLSECHPAGRPSRRRLRPPSESGIAARGLALPPHSKVPAFAALPPVLCTVCPL